jgi:hypothetical protein
MNQRVAAHGENEADPTSAALLLDAWLDDAGRQASATTATATAQSSPSWVDELRTLCLLANTCLLHHRHAEPASTPTPTAAAAGCYYLKGLAVRGQLCLRPHIPREKRRLAAHNLSHARAVLQPALAALEPAWQARVASVHARLLAALGRGGEAGGVLREAVAAMKGGRGEGSSGLARAFLLLEMTQLGYYDRLGAAVGAEEAEACCRRALAELQLGGDGGGLDEEEEEGMMDVDDAGAEGGGHQPPAAAAAVAAAAASPLRAALIATAAFRLADLLLVRATTAGMTALAEEALALCRLSLRHAAPAHAAALGAYMAHALALLGSEGEEARAEVEGEVQRARRRGGVGQTVTTTTSSLLSLGGADAWQLPATGAAGGGVTAAEAAAAAAAVAGGLNRGVELKGAAAPGMELPPTITALGILTNHQQQPPLPSLPLPSLPAASPRVVEEEKSEQPPSPTRARPIPITEEEMDVDGVVVGAVDDDTMSYHTNTPSSVVVAAGGHHHHHHGQNDAGAPPAPKRTRLSYYPFHQLKPRVTLPCWVGAK